MPKPTYDSVISFTLSSSANNIIIGTGGTGIIPSTFTDLVLVIDGKLVTGGTGSCNLRFNGVTATQYSFSRLLNTGAVFANARQTNQTSMIYADQSSGKFTNVVNIMDYSNTDTATTVLSQQYQDSYQGIYIGRWNNSSIIDSITVIGHQSYDVGTTFSLYGIKAE